MCYIEKKLIESVHQFTSEFSVCLLFDNMQLGLRLVWARVGLHDNKLTVSWTRIELHTASSINRLHPSTIPSLSFIELYCSLPSGS